MNQIKRILFILIALALCLPAAGGFATTAFAADAGLGLSYNFASEITIESMSVTNSAGQALDRVTKDSKPFNIVITYIDYGEGMDQIDFRYATDINNLEVFLTNAGSFVPAGGNRGTIRALSDTSSDAPRFRVEFKNISWDGKSNSLSFQVRYNVSGFRVSSEGSVTVYQAQTADEEENNPETPPPTPYIIISEYSFGEGDIEAGSSFTLDISFKNTSGSIPLENIVMTITTPEDLSIAMASNTYYISSLGAGASMPYSIELGVKPNASVGSHGVKIDFKYQYLSGKERKIENTTENIAIPVTQIDRFSVDPITEMPGGLMGEAAYISVSFINRGKSATYNITGTASANHEIIVQPAHYGNLEPGKSDSIDITLVPQEPGELFGEIIIQYEDENTNQKEIRVPFTMYVDQPYRPEFTPPPDIGIIEPPPPNNAPKIVLCVAGGLLMAAPIMLYLIKRVKAKGSEDFDEGF